VIAKRPRPLTANCAEESVLAGRGRHLIGEIEATFDALVEPCETNAQNAEDVGGFAHA
jgi:hypothetical protein